jgi:hypothetical protein
MDRERAKIDNMGGEAVDDEVLSEPESSVPSNTYS